MNRVSWFKFFTPSYWKSPVQAEPVKEEPLTLENVTHDELLAYLYTLGAGEEHLQASEGMFKFLEDKGFKNLVPYLAGAYSLMFKTDKPTPEHLKAFAAFVVACAKHIPINKALIYNSAGIFLLKMKEGMPAKDIPFALFHEICGPGKI